MCQSRRASRWRPGVRRDGIRRTAGSMAGRGGRAARFGARKGQSVSDKVGQSVLDAVGELLPVLRERAQESEDARQIPAESVKALAEAGFFKLLQPASYGGVEADPGTFYEGVRMIASACGSTGWVASVVGVHAWQLALFPPEAQQEVWGDDPGTRMSSAYAPTGRAQQTEGGY